MRYGPEYWDKHGLYRAPLAFSLTLLVLLRTYLIWLVVAVSRRPELDLMGLFYANKQQFFVLLATALPALLVTIVFMLRKPDNHHRGMARWLWRHSRWLLMLSVCLDMAALVITSSIGVFHFHAMVAVQGVLLLWVAMYLLKSRYLSVFFNDWPSDPNAD